MPAPLKKYKNESKIDYLCRLLEMRRRTRSRFLIPTNDFKILADAIKKEEELEQLRKKNKENDNIFIYRA